mmetsp:Transcript_3817/g.5926  ORF Transcript_3817/g.5926 Transcript_3817/m.5926 type:complete len:561 (-) Transcript_3817:27-1709(-)
MRQAVAGGEKDLLHALGYDEEDFRSPRFAAQQKLQKPLSTPPYPVAANLQADAISQPWYSKGVEVPRTRSMPTPNGAWDLAERLAEHDPPAEDVRILRLALQNAREREAAAITARADAEICSRRATLEVAELRAEVAGCWRREEALIAELRSEKIEAAAASESLSAEICSLREKIRLQSRRDEVSLNTSNLECRQLEYELQAATSRAHLEMSEMKVTFREELEQERLRLSAKATQAPSSWEKERVELLEKLSRCKAPVETSMPVALKRSAPSLGLKQQEDASEIAGPCTPPPEAKSELLEAVASKSSEESSLDSSVFSNGTSSKSDSLESDQHRSPPTPTSPNCGSSAALGRPPLAPNSPTPGFRTGPERCKSSNSAPATCSSEGEKQAVGSHSREKAENKQKMRTREGRSNEMLGRDLFRRAEALCAQQRHEEAIPLFEEVLKVLRDHNNETLDQRALVVAQADVWAHLGVSMQSLDRMHEALASYGRAVALNPELHACFANLATLHLYLRNTETARRHIGRALEVKPEEEAYLEIQKEVEEQAKRRSRSSERKATSSS